MLFADTRRVTWCFPSHSTAASSRIPAASCLHRSASRPRVAGEEGRRRASAGLATRFRVQSPDRILLTDRRALLLRGLCVSAAPAPHAALLSEGGNDGSVSGHRCAQTHKTSSCGSLRPAVPGRPPRSPRGLPVTQRHPRWCRRLAHGVSSCCLDPPPGDPVFITLGDYGAWRPRDVDGGGGGAGVIPEMLFPLGSDPRRRFLVGIVTMTSNRATTRAALAATRERSTRPPVRCAREDAVSSKSLS